MYSLSRNRGQNCGLPTSCFGIPSPLLLSLSLLVLGEEGQSPPFTNSRGGGSIAWISGAIRATYSASLLNPTGRGSLQCGGGMDTLASGGLIKADRRARGRRASLGKFPARLSVAIRYVSTHGT